MTALGKIRALTLALSLALAPGLAAGQSLVATGGLGVPVDAVDARARALGGVGVGLMGGGVSAVDPTAAVDVRIPTIAFSSLSSWVDVEEGGAPGSFSATRFPAMGLAYPAGGWGTFTLTFGGVLDQRWTVEEARTVQLEGTTTTATDRFVSEGGVSAARLGFARRVAPSLGVGVSIGALTGDLSRTLTRSFDTLTADLPITDFEVGGRWDYSGVTAAAGAVVDVGGLFRGTATLTWNGTLDADPAEGTEGAPRSFDLPLEIRLGATGVLAPGLSAVVGLSWADWGATRDDLVVGPVSAGSATAFGGGVEWDQARLLGKDAALRLGFRRADLPFGFGGAGAEESAFTAGLGLVLAPGPINPLAAVDLTLDRGSRSSGLLAEDFWRVGVTLRVSGF